jgi:trigger factor
MNVTVDHLGPCKKLLRVEVPVEGVNAAIDEITGLIQRQAQLPGFRPGKAPRHLVVSSFEQRIHDEARRKLFQDSFRKASEQEKLRVIATLNVEEQPLARGTPYTFTITCEVAPEFSLPEYKGLKARREISVPSDTDVEKALDILRDQRVAYNNVDREAKSGDYVVVNYRGSSEGKPLTEFAPAARG